MMILTEEMKELQDKEITILLDYKTHPPIWEENGGCVL